jgi:hypothetical protein
MKGQLGGRFQAPAGGRGRMGGPVAGGPGGTCVCRACGYTRGHAVGEPCYQYRCPKCGIALARQA